LVNIKYWQIAIVRLAKYANFILMLFYNLINFDEASKFYKF